MTQVSVGNRPLLFPALWSALNLSWGGGAGGLGGSSTTLDAAGEKIAVIGAVYWDGRPSGAKTFGTSSTIAFRFTSATFADATGDKTVLRVGIQDVLAAGVTFPQPDGTFDVYDDLVAGTDTITAGAVKTVTMSSGSKSITHGDLIAVVVEMVTRGAAATDTVAVTGYSIGTSTSGGYGLPAQVNYITGSWALSISIATMTLVADDGTRGTFIGWLPSISTADEYAYQASTNPDERGIVFQVPFACKMDSVRLGLYGNNTAADCSVYLYSTPLGTPTEVWSFTIPGDQLTNGTTAPGIQYYALPAEHTLTAATDYCLAIKATGTANIGLGYVTLNSADDRGPSGLANVRGAYRNDGSGAFTESTTIIPILQIGISSVDDGTGTGSASPRFGDRTGGLR